MKEQKPTIVCGVLVNVSRFTIGLELEWGEAFMIVVPFFAFIICTSAYAKKIEESGYQDIANG